MILEWQPKDIQKFSLDSIKDSSVALSFLRCYSVFIFHGMFPARKSQSFVYFRKTNYVFTGTHTVLVIIKCKFIDGFLHCCYYYYYFYYYYYYYYCYYSRLIINVFLKSREI